MSDEGRNGRPAGGREKFRSGPLPLVPRYTEFDR